MTPVLQLRRPLSVVLAICAAAVTLLFLWPVSLGGAMSYVVVAGPSMEPTYSSGDFVVARSEPSYEPGEVVVYLTEGGQVIHRIVEVEADGTLKLQGDNNPHPDIFTPTADAVVGAVQWHVPGLGRWLLILRTVLLTPPMPYLLAGLTFLTLALSDSKRKTAPEVPRDGADDAQDVAGAPKPSKSGAPV